MLRSILTAAKKSVQNPPVGGNRYDLPRNELAGRLQGALGGIFQPAAAGHLHAHNGDLLNVVAADNGGQLLTVIDVVQLGAAHQRDVPADEPLVERGVGVGRAVGSNQQPRTVKVGRVHRHQLDLHGPLAQLAGGRRRGALPCLGGVQGLGHAARADVHCFGRTAGAAGRVGGLVLPGGLHGGLVVGRGLALLKRNGPRGAVRQAVAHAVAVVVAHQRGLAADHGDRALVAGGGAGPAAVAFLLVDVNDLSFHGQPP